MKQIQTYRKELAEITEAGGNNMNLKLSALMTELERVYHIPLFGDCSKVPAEVMVLYRDVSQARKF